MADNTLNREFDVDAPDLFWGEPLCAIGSRTMASAVVESFFNLLKRESIRRRKYKTREEARRDVFDYIEFFYNSSTSEKTQKLSS